MAKKRMFTLDIVDSDAFLDLPLSTQALYFHLCMRADDDGFLGNARRVTAYIGASPDDLKLLLAKRFLLVFPSGVVCIKHWKMHNAIRPDRLEPTAYQEELKSLTVKANKSYTDRVPADCLPNDGHDDRHNDGHDDRIDLDIDKDRLDSDIDKDKGQTASGGVALADELSKAFKKYEAFRKGIKKPLTYESKILLINKLNSYPEQDRLEIVNTATERGWMSFFPLDKPTSGTEAHDQKYENQVLAFLENEKGKINVQ